MQLQSLMLQEKIYTDRKSLCSIWDREMLFLKCPMFKADDKHAAQDDFNQLTECDYNETQRPQISILVHVEGRTLRRHQESWKKTHQKE